MEFCKVERDGRLETALACDVTIAAGSEDFREGVTAFVEKRKPAWRNR